jgi:hypothetical protein
MLGLAEQVKAKILQTSTPAVLRRSHRASADGRVLGSVNPIGRGNGALKILLFYYRQPHNLAIRGVRIFDTHGSTHAPQGWPRGFKFYRAGFARAGAITVSVLDT